MAMVLIYLWYFFLKGLQKLCQPWRYSKGITYEIMIIRATYSNSVLLNKSGTKTRFVPSILTQYIR